MKLVMQRVRALFALIVESANEWKMRMDGKPIEAPIMLRRRLQPVWLLDRTVLQAAVKVIMKFGDDTLKPLLLLIAIAYGFVSWRTLTSQEASRC